ncbi:uncharacterized protein LOC105196358 isoform X1 [Solenopsis invicta]|uniref:uncharacterized protein LOC105196358 isoform X1 n=1 Tax=Solenopsis invicta TaxID=13686 RepID=UPI00193CAEB9|nr:uncharacterized protein LOC105196358 isoform X1 [Solenopsis invicta]
MQCILRRSNSVIMAVRALSLVLLFTFVTVIFGLPTSKLDDSSNAETVAAVTEKPEEQEEHTLSLELQPPFLDRSRRDVNVETIPNTLKSAVNTHEEHTLSTELQPPPVPLEEREHHAIIYIINLYAVKNGSSNVSEEMFQNEVVKTIPDILEPLVSVLLVVEDDDENEELEKPTPVDLDEFAQGLEGQGFKVDKIDLDNKAKVLKMKLEKAEAQSMIDSALKEKRYRQKRTICFKCGGGGWGKPKAVIVPVVVVPITGGRRRHHGGYGGGGGCGNRCGGGGGYGGGGGGGWSQSSASAQASSSSGGYGWGKK